MSARDSVKKFNVMKSFVYFKPPLKERKLSFYTWKELIITPLSQRFENAYHNLP